MSGPHSGAAALACVAASAGRPERVAGVGRSWNAPAFGLDVRGDFAAPGLAPGPVAPPGAPIVRIRILSGREHAGAWPLDRCERLLHWRLEGGATVMTIDRDPQLGYRLHALDQGTYVVAADGTTIACLPPAAEPWMWQRFLIGQVLPLAAVLNGYEALHASAVAVDGRAVAFAADSGVGKTSLALNLVLRGARFLTDDVTAISLRDGHPTVHPGPGLTNLRREEDACLGPRRALLGNVIGSDPYELRLALRRDPEPAPLAALYLLERIADGTAPRFEEIVDIGFATLMSLRYTRFLSTPERLRRQLDVYGAIADGVRVFRLSVPSAVGADELSAHVESHVRDDL